MSSTRPVRSSARQTAIRQQEREAELEAERIAKQLQDEKISARQNSERNVNPIHNEHNNNNNNNRDHDDDENRPHSSASSSRSLSPALSDSSSLSSDGASDSGSPEVSQKKKAGEDDPYSVSDLHSSWEMAFVYGFLVKFKGLLRQNCPLPEFSIEDIEEGLLSKSSNACIEDIHANLLSNLLNRKKAVDSATWQKVLADTMDVKHRAQELEYDQNLMRYYGDYYWIPPPERVHILKTLVHWVLQEGVVVRGGIEEENERYKVEPLGTDDAKRVYWYFGEGTRIYREPKELKKKNSGWETVTSTLEEIKGLVESLKSTGSKREKELQARLQEEIIDPIEDKILQTKLKQERLEKRMHKLAGLHQMAATRTTRTRSSNRLNQPKYTFDDNEDDFEDEYDLYRRPSSRRRYELGGADQQEQHQQEQQERSGSVEAASSARSSVGRDSDTSIRDALQRAHVGDEDEVSPGRSDRESVENDGDYKFEEDKDDDEQDLAPQAAFISVGNAQPTPLSVPVLAPVPVPAPVPEPALGALVEDIEMNNANI
ncbi:hypothetical protein EDD21DRAFT_242545 [Dissophora ornata]|nr:hypothetical protein EDD21DRAFT_242545 [Dissophora ornata]